MDAFRRLQFYGENDRLEKNYQAAMAYQYDPRETTALLTEWSPHA